ncbi:DUF418 domain-containing protein [Brevibacillus laterosporus]|uniref:DUF418 domain-containing protein n=1 Tax=Brevibacillus laterosporus TaxID=1465 RepID=A0AAP8QFV0_BRELA|nr:hypothetical protein C4A76_19265 [Brevibacillus laterosporus]PPB10725.1 hypothetical protein C4A77_03610 [Brevibacillus laterosporus]
MALWLWILQVVASFWYLRYFSCGPLERLLRMWTYFSWSRKPTPRIASTISMKKTG